MIVYSLLCMHESRSMKYGLLLLAAILAPAAHAAIWSYDLEWSGAPFSNSASAVGTITINDAFFTNPGGTTDFSFPGNALLDLSVTVSGSGVGSDGTYSTADFNFYVFNYPDLIDFSLPLIGQAQGPLFFGADPVVHGCPGTSCGDFNIFRDPGSPAAPNGSTWFTLQTSSGLDMLLTGFNPVAVPLPPTFAMLGLGLVGLGLIKRRPT